MTIRIGNIELTNNVLLAPMTGVSDLPFRRMVKRYGAALVFSEMIASKAMVLEVKNALRMAKHEPEEHPMAVQLAGCEPEVMAEAARMNEATGAAIIDINFGCPVKKVAIGQMAGSAMMRDEDHAVKVLEAVVKAVKIPVTMKMRTGWDDSNRNAPSLAKKAEDVGIQMLTVHGRTRCQLYKGAADWAFIRRVKDIVKIPVIANGDITSVEKARQCLELSGADGVMIARGSYGRPWFIHQAAHFLQTGEVLPEPALVTQMETLLEHYDAMLSHYGTIEGVRVARKHLGWSSTGMHGAAEFRHKVMQLTDPDEVRSTIRAFYQPFVEQAGAGQPGQLAA